MRLHLVVLFLFVVLLNCCKTQPKKVTPEKNKTNTDSIQVVKKPFEYGSEAIEYEIPVLRSNNKKHGIQKRFYRHGSLYSSISYLNGKREGVALTYYPVAEDVKPVVWKEQVYANNKLNGICKRYHKNGILQAEYEYKNGNRGIGIKEFSQSGKPIKQPYLILTSKRVTSGIYITAHLSNNSEKVNYYIGELDEGKFLSKGLKGLQVKKGLGEIVVDGSTKRVTITAIYTTRYRNNGLISRTIAL